jgi:hypothetical protein
VREWSGLSKRHEPDHVREKTDRKLIPPPPDRSRGKSPGTGQVATIGATGRGQKQKFHAQIEFSDRDQSTNGKKNSSIDSLPPWWRTLQEPVRKDKGQLSLSGSPR